MNSNEKNVFIILIGGIPGIGKTYLANKIISEYKDIYDIKYLNFDLIENINKDNYLQYQQMRNDYLLKIQEILNTIDDISKDNNSLLIILDDNFFLKSMRKKIYNAILDKIMQINKIINQIKFLQFYYLEILLKPTDINYCLKLNSCRDEKQTIPENIIINMNNLFEYSSPYTNKSQSIILNINNEENLNNLNLIKDIFKDKEKYLIKQKEKETKDKIIIEKDNKGKLIDDLEDIIRKEINIILKTNEKYRKKGKEISICKKEYMKKISNYIKTMEVNIDKISIKSSIFDLLKECIINNISNFSQNENNTNIIKEDFILFLNESIIDI